MSGGFESFYSISSNIYLSLTTQIFNEQFCNHERTTVIDNFSPLPVMESEKKHLIWEFSVSHGSHRLTGSKQTK